MKAETAARQAREHRPLGMHVAPGADLGSAMPESEPIRAVLFRVMDIACSLAAFFAAYAVLPWAKDVALTAVTRAPFLKHILSPASNGPGIPSRADLWWVFVVASLGMTLTLEYAGDKRPLAAESAWTILRGLLLSVAVALAAVATVFFTLRVAPYSRIFLCGYLAILFVLAAGCRAIVKAVEAQRRRSGAAAPHVLIAGTADGIDGFLSVVSPSLAAHDMTIAGCVLTAETGGIPRSDVKHMGYVDDLGDLLIHHPIDQVVVVLPDGEANWLTEVIEHCDYFRVGMHILHECFLDLQLRDLKHFNHRCPVPSIRLSPDEELSTNMLLWKRMLDVVLSLAALIVLAPLMAAIAVAIKVTTPHLPVLYRWNVVGYRGRRFTGYKFTTMVADADERKAGLSHQNEMSGPVFKIRNDPRVTPLGRFLRKYSLNELPQFWSVLTGDMSLVGPRPAGPHELVRYELWQKRKLSVQPGITCFWQVRGRNTITNFDEWVRMDLEYIQKRGFWTDITILLRTVTTVLRGTGC